MIVKKCGIAPKPGEYTGRPRYRIKVEDSEETMKYVDAYNTKTPAPNGDKVISVRVHDDAPASIWLEKAKAGDFE